MKFAALFLLSLAPLGQAESPGYFIPAHRVSGIGIARDDISADLLAARTDLMIQSQTFGIMREALAVPGAKRITGDPKLQAIFRSAAERSHMPASLIEAIAYLESWGDPKAESVTGPKGIMQISGATARNMGLKVVQATRYKVTRDKVAVKSAGKPKYQDCHSQNAVRSNHPRRATDAGACDSRLPPSIWPAWSSISADATGRSSPTTAVRAAWSEMQELTRRAHGIPKDEVTVPRMFFSCSPAWNRELFQAIQQQMQRDYSPDVLFPDHAGGATAGAVPARPRGLPGAFPASTRANSSPECGAPHRLSVWLKRDDLVYRSCDDIRADVGKRLVKALDRPSYFGYLLRLDPGPAREPGILFGSFAFRHGNADVCGLRDAPPVRRAASPGEKFRAARGDVAGGAGRPGCMPSGKEAWAHCSGHVFDLDYAGLPPGELQCLRFVLDDLGWDGYLGFVADGLESMHIGCSPSSRDFFSTVFQEGAGTVKSE